jgi:hypothetical protein
MSEEIKFLKELQEELKTQDTDYQAAPRFWTVGDYRWIRTSEDDAERYSVYLPNDAQCYEQKQLNGFKITLTKTQS